MTRQPGQSFSDERSTERGRSSMRRFLLRNLLRPASSVFHAADGAASREACYSTFAAKASKRPSQSFTTNSPECQGVSARARVNSTPRLAYSAFEIRAIAERHSRGTARPGRQITRIFLHQEVATSEPLAPTVLARAFRSAVNAVGANWQRRPISCSIERRNMSRFFPRTSSGFRLPRRADAASAAGYRYANRL